MSALPVVAPNTAFYQKLQADGASLVELIDLEYLFGIAFRWTTCNVPVTYTLSGAPTVYQPFPGMTPGGLKQSNNLQVAAVNFSLINSGASLQNLIENDFSTAKIKVGRVFADTPNLGRMEVYNGQVGDFTYTRLEITGQARNIWKSLNIKWPYYSYQDTCAWRFGSFGCGFNTSSVTVSLNSLNVGSSTTLNLLCNSGTLTQSFANDRLDFGRLTVLTGTNSGVVRTIRIQSGDLITLANALPNADFTSMTFNVFPGCRKRLINDCTSLYNNNKNFLGWPWIILQPLPRFKVK